ncbi:MAG: ABC transporter ATP-binding protein, partial [Bdellovibrionales bacterium]|nr:ABC transporter ATP-binding protein [Bdellovibrionales bacterium]
CRPPLDVRLKRLPIVSDFMKVDDQGTIEEIEQSVTEATEKEIQTDAERKQDHEEMYAKEPVLQIKNLKTYFPLKKNFFGKVTEEVKAVDDVTFDVYPGETLGLVGESGCGKTTLGRTVLRLVDPTDGEVIFKGKPLHSMTTDELREIRKDIQIIFQDPYSSLNPRITIGEAIMEPMKVHKLYSSDKERKEKVMELLVTVGLMKDHYYRYPHEFSG